MHVLNTDDIRRHGKTILLGHGFTATEGISGNLRTLSIRKDGKKISSWRGSSLYFNTKLTEKDKKYLVALALDD